jgi:DNA-binding LacI/PurR family transcriptional regulator
LTASKPRPTYAEIAKLAKVSEATVSRVLNGDDRVHPDRVKRVQRAVEKLGYRRHRVAAALASGKSGLIAIVIEDDLGVFADPFWATVSSGVSQVLMDNGLQTLLLVSETNPVDGPVSHYLQSGEIDGAIFFQMHRDALMKALAKQGLPVVITGAPHKVGDFVYVDSDQRGGADVATTHLINIGCKRLATITGDTGATAGRLRLDGFLDAARRSSQTIPRHFIAQGDYSFESGRAAMIELLSADNVPDGVFVANDLMAAGALSAITDAGLTCPDDIKIVGFDDSVIAQTTRPALSTVRQDIVGLGMTAAGLMIDLLNGKMPKPVILPTELVIRASST